MEGERICPAVFKGWLIKLVSITMHLNEIPRDNALLVFSYLWIVLSSMRRAFSIRNVCDKDFNMKSLCLLGEWLFVS